MKGIEKLILGCFFLSGLTALVYEVIWIRMMVLIFGATTLATSTVLTAFMGGLALGSLIFGRYRPRWGHPLLLYGLLEIGIGVYALLIPSMLSSLVPVYQKVWMAYAPSFYAFSLLRFVLVAVVLLIPTALMGATLPVLSRLFEKYSGEAGRRIGFLYAFNTFGAVVGVFSAGYLLLPTMGVHQSTVTAAIANFLVAGVAFILWKRVSSEKGRVISEQSAVSSKHAPRATDHSSLGTKHQALSTKHSARTTHHTPRTTQPSQLGTGSSQLGTRNSELGTRNSGLETQNSELETRNSEPGTFTTALVLIALALSGFAAMVYEVAWSRALSLVMGSTIYAFSAMLTTFLVGLALGSFLCATIVERIRSRVLLFGLIQIGIGILGFFTLYLMGQLPYLFVGFYKWVSSTPHLISFVWFGTSFLVMLLPTLLMGALFPLAVRIVHFRIPGFGRLAGDVYAVNTIGAILGAFCGGFILIPLMGIQGSTLTAVYLNLFLGLILIISGQQEAGGVRIRVQGFLKWGLAGGIILVAMIFVWIKPVWNAKIMSSGVFLGLPKHAALLERLDHASFLEDLQKGRELLFYREGITATIAVEEDPMDGLLMKVNGRQEAGERLMRTQVLIGHLPMLLSERADDVLVIGFGTGATVKSVSRYPVKAIRAVELEPAVIEASKFFFADDNHPLNDPRVEVLVNDGRNVLLASPETYDVIISQPSMPWITGASNLFTREFFDLGARRLREGGVFGQWITADAISLDNFKSLVKSFNEIFPHTWLFETIPGDVFLVGSKEELHFSFEKVAATLSQESLKQDLQRVGVENPYDFLVLYKLGDKEINQFVSNAVPNTDDNALVELTGPIHYYLSTPTALYASIGKEIYDQAARSFLGNARPFWTDSENSTESVFLSMAEAEVKNQRGPWSLLYTDLSLRTKETSEGHIMRANSLASLATQMKMSKDRDPESIENVLVEVVREYERALQMNPSNKEAVHIRYELGEYYYHRGQIDLAAKQYEELVKIEPSSGEALMNLGSIYAQEGRFNEALVSFQKFLKSNPEDARAFFRIGLIHLALAKYPEAIRNFEKALKTAPDDLAIHYNLARVYELNHQKDEAIASYQHLLALTPSESHYDQYRKEARIQLGKLLQKYRDESR